MRCKIISGLMLSCICLLLKAQVGVRTPTPNSTLVVNGSFEADYKEIVTTNYVLTADDHYITYNGYGNSNFRLPEIKTGTKSFTGRIYKIKNISTSDIMLRPSDGNTIRVNNQEMSSFTIPAGAYVEVVNNANVSGGTWDLSFTAFPKPSQVDIYGAQLKIPPHGNGMNCSDWTNHNNYNYDSGTGNDRWWIISKRSSKYVFTSKFIRTSRMTLVYEYQGKPFNIHNMYPIITCGNNSNYPDVFTGSFVRLANDGVNGKTRLTVTVARVDFVGCENDDKSDWEGMFLMNILLVRSLSIS